MEVNIIENESVITVELKGRMDTAASQEVSGKILPLQEKAENTIVMDCSQLSYISSSGLRLLWTITHRSPNRRHEAAQREHRFDCV